MKIYEINKNDRIGTIYIFAQDLNEAIAKFYDQYRKIDIITIREADSNRPPAVNQDMGKIYL